MFCELLCFFSKAQVVLQGKSRNTIIRELQRTVSLNYTEVVWELLIEVQSTAKFNPIKYNYTARIGSFRDQSV